MGFWEEQDLTPKIEAILRGQKPSKQYAHFGRPFLTAIQLAEKFRKKHPEISKRIHKDSSESQDALYKVADYLVKELFGRISIGRITSIEGAVLSTFNLKKLDFSINELTIESHIGEDSLDLFVFRYR